MTKKPKLAFVNCPAWEIRPPFKLSDLAEEIKTKGYKVETFDFESVYKDSAPELEGSGFWNAKCSSNWAIDYECLPDIRFVSTSKLDLFSMPADEWARKVLESTPHVIAFATTETNLAVSLCVANEIKHLDSEVQIIFGGANLTKNRKGEIILKTGIPDAVLDGQSIDSLIEVLDCISGERNISEVNGVGYTHAGKIEWTKPRTIVQSSSESRFKKLTFTPSGKPRLALINCPAWGAIPPLGIATLKSFMVENGYDVKCFDFNLEFYNSSEKLVQRDFWGASCYDQWMMDYNSIGNVKFKQGSFFNKNPLPLEEWMEAVLSFQPDAVGFSTNITNMTSSLLLARHMKNKLPDLPIIFGGPNVAKDREGNIALNTGIPDIIVNREGEISLLEIMKVLQIDGDFSEVLGIGYLLDGIPHWTSMRPQIKDLDSLPFPDFNDFSLGEYPNPYDIPIMASRGCVYHCAFCYETVFWKKFRTRSGQNIVDEMVFRLSEYDRMLKEENSEVSTNNKRKHDYMGLPPESAMAEKNPNFTFLFADSLVNGHFKALEEMCDLIIENELNIKWGGQATLDKRMTKDVINKFKQSGCIGLAFGFESGSQKVLDSMSKNYKLIHASDILKDFHEGGMPPTVNVMVGFPSETFEDFLETVKFLFKNRKWIGQVSNVTETQAALGTPLHETPEKFDMTFQSDGSWTSPNAGTEKDRKRRLKLLHWAMTLMRIPHQKIASD